MEGRKEKNPFIRARDAVFKGKNDIKRPRGWESPLPTRIV